MEPERPLLASLRQGWRNWLPFWAVALTWAVVGLVPSAASHAKFLFWVVVPFFFAAFFYGARPAATKGVPFWHVVLWLMFLPFAMSAVLALLWHALALAGAVLHG